MKKYILTALSVAMLGVVTTNVTTNAKADEKSDKMEMIIPGYSYPSESSQYWSTLQKDNTSIAYTVLNQNNGDFTSKDANYERLFKENTAHGLNNLAYVHLSYGSRDIKAIEANIDAYINLYGKDNVKGFFLDETDTLDAKGRNQLKTLYQYIKAKNPDLLVVANRGTSVTDEAYDYADVFCTFESSADSYINDYRKDISKWESDPTKADKIMHIVYEAKPEDYNKIVELAKQRHVKYLFVTSDGNKAYHKTTDYFDELPTQFTTLQTLLKSNTKKLSENSDNSKVVEQPKAVEQPKVVEQPKAVEQPKTVDKSDQASVNLPELVTETNNQNASLPDTFIKKNSVNVSEQPKLSQKETALKERERQKAEYARQKEAALKERERQKAEYARQKAEAIKERERQKAEYKARQQAEKTRQKEEARKEKERRKAEYEKQKAEARKERERQKAEYARQKAEAQARKHK